MSAPGPTATPSSITAKPVLLVQASSSAPNAQERTYSASVTTRVADWLKATGIAVRTVDDDGLTRGAWADASVVVLCSNPNPGFLELLALRRFVSRGGKVIVFYSASPRLARLLGLRLGAYAAANEPGQWSAFRFNTAAPAGTPERVEQDSRNIRPAFPDSAGAQVIAWWENADGKTLRDPAWVRSERGFWMSHVLLEGDGEAKTAMLLALVGACDPTLWRVAANRALATAGALGRFGDAPKAMAALGQNAGNGGQSARVLALLAEAGRYRDTLVGQYRDGNNRQVVATARLLDAAMAEAYARTIAARPGEFRGVWNHSGLGLRPGQWAETCRILADGGLTAIFPNVCRPWMAHFKSALIPASDAYRKYGDQLGDCIRAAREAGLEAHAWVICWNLEGAPANAIAAYRKQGRLQVSASGEILPWLCPSDPRNLAFEIESIRDMAIRYRPGGVHLDYIRYKSPDYCFCAGCRERFARDTGRVARRWPADVRSGPLTNAWREWRHAQITRMVSHTRQALRRAAPGVKLSAAVYTGYPGCRDSIGQDWGTWVQRGYVDFVCPMNYTEDPAKFAAWYRKQAAWPGVAEHSYPGLGVTAAESRLDAVGALEQIQALRGAGAPGFMLFEANSTLTKEILPYLKAGATARK
jgi:uncharacterized lipoprotein YddW (UPF0748 family)